jgi:hypothetical protein
MGEIYKSLKKKAKEGEDSGDTAEDAVGRIYKMPSQKDEFGDMLMVAEKNKGKKDYTTKG